MKFAIALIISALSLTAHADYSKEACVAASRATVRLEKQIEQKSKEIAKLSIDYGQKLSNESLDGVKYRINKKIEEIRTLEGRWNQLNDQAVQNCI